MSFKEFTDIAWNILVVDGWGVAWRIGLAAVAATPVGILLTVLCYRLFYKREALKLSWRHQKYFEYTIVALWLCGIPSLTVASGTLIGSWWAGNFIIVKEHLGERIGKTAFQAVAAGVVASQLETSEHEKAKMAHALMKGQQKLSIKEISKYTAHHAGELSAQQIQQLLPVQSPHIHDGTVWAVEKCLNTMALYQLGSEGDVLYLLVVKVAEHDRKTDNDGLVTVEEISDVACKAFLDNATKNLWAALILQLLLPVLAALALLMLAPAALAWLIRRLVAWRTAPRS